jgi:tripartite-type tricarboxylate transporter receptor subunit TctC
MKALAVTGEKRHGELPNVPTIAESFPGVGHDDWFALVAPPKTPPQIAARLSQAVAEVLKLPDVAKRFAEFHVTTVGNSPEETGALMKREAEQFRVLIATTGIKIQ